MNATERAQLEQVIRATVARVGKYAGQPFNEQNTKASLIEPVMSALGWDTTDPEQVHREFKTNTKDNPVDYALMMLRQPRLVVEAKALGESMDDHKWRNQTLSYATVCGAPWCVLTNGDEYQIYNVTAPVKAADRLLCRVRVTVDTVGDVAELLSLVSRNNLGENIIDVLWQTQHVDRRVKAALEGMIADKDLRLISAVRNRDAGLSTKDVVASLTRLSVRIEQPQVRIPAKNVIYPRLKPGACKQPQPRWAS